MRENSKSESGGHGARSGQSGLGSGMGGGGSWVVDRVVNQRLEVLVAENMAPVVVDGVVRRLEV